MMGANLRVILETNEESENYNNEDDDEIDDKQSREKIKSFSKEIEKYNSNLRIIDEISKEHNNYDKINDWAAH